MEQARRDAARAAARERAERERQEAAAAEAVRQALPCEDCGRDQAAGLCEACDHRRQTETLIGEAALLAAAGSADLFDPGGVEAVTSEARTAIGSSIAAAWEEFLQITDVAALEADPEAARDAYAFTAFETARQAVQEFQATALAMLGRTEEAEAEARRAFKAEQGRPWFQHNPTGADTVAAATKAADAARERVAGYLLATRLEQLREQTAVRTEPAAVAPWTDRLPELAARPLDGDATWGGDRVSTEPSGVDLARQALVAAREAAKSDPRQGHPGARPAGMTGCCRARLPRFRRPPRISRGGRRQLSYAVPVSRWFPADSRRPGRCGWSGPARRGR
ncbi:hypothetical protein AB0L67_28605 [Streptomyces flaveolus]|uniref:hypothetical protein n=1 Tax=Streptomyces flaveolus TaxID=67297 RepID=UPI0034437318